MKLYKDDRGAEASCNWVLSFSYFENKNIKGPRNGSIMWINLQICLPLEEEYFPEPSSFS